MTENPPVSAGSEPGTSLLDLLAVVAASWKLLVFTPIVAALLAAAVLQVLPREYESRALLRLGPNSVMLSAPNVLGSVITTLGLQKELGGNIDRAVANLAKKVRFGPYMGSDITTVSVRYDSPEKAQRILDEIVKVVFQRSIPQGGVRDDMERNVANLQSSVVDLDKFAEKLRVSLPEGTDAENYSRALATIISDSQAMKAQVITIERHLKGLGSEAVVAAPSLPDQAVSRRGSAIVVFAALVVGFILLCFVMVRNAIEMAKLDPVASAKLMRIRDGFRWWTRLIAK